MGTQLIFIYLVDIRPFWRGGCCRDVKIRQNKGVYFALITVEPWFNEGPRDWQNQGFVKSRFFFIYFTTTGVKKFGLYTEDFII